MVQEAIEKDQAENLVMDHHYLEILQIVLVLQVSLVLYFNEYVNLFLLVLPTFKKPGTTGAYSIFESE
jgi:hypothetical protein